MIRNKLEVCSLSSTAEFSEWLNWKTNVEKVIDLLETYA